MDYQFLPRKLDVLICIGQSNMDGSVIGPHTAPYLGYKECYIFHKPDASATDNGMFESFKWKHNNNFGTPKQYVQPIAPMVTEFHNLTQRPLLIIRHSRGGSAMVDNGQPYANGFWQIDGNPDNGTNHYQILMDNFVLPAVQKSLLMSVKLNFIGIWICQGEADCTTQYRAERWGAVFQKLFYAVKDSLLEYGMIDPRFKPLITRVHNNFNPARPFTDVVRQQQMDAAAALNGHWIDSDGFELAPDFTHYSIAGQEQHGLAAAQVLANSF